MNTRLTLLFALIVNIALGQFPQDSLITYIPYDNSPNDSGKFKLGVLADVNTSYTDNRFGDANKAVYFNGNAFIQMRDTSAMDFSAKKQFSAGFWYKSDNQLSKGQHAMVSLDSDCDDFRYTFQIKNDTSILFGMDGDGQEGNSGCWNLYEMPGKLNTWTHLAATMDDKEFKIYKNGIQVFSRVLTETSYTFYPSRMMIGAWRTRGTTTTVNHYTGAIDDVFFYNKVLSPTEVLNIYKHPVTTNMNHVGHGNKFSVYPNPAQGVVNVLVRDKTLSKIEMFNILGEKVLETSSTLSLTKLDVRNLSKGVYLVSVSNNQKAYTQKVTLK